MKLFKRAGMRLVSLMLAAACFPVALVSVSCGEDTASDSGYVPAESSSFPDESVGWSDGSEPVSVPGGESGSDSGSSQGEPYDFSCDVTIYPIPKEFVVKEEKYLDFGAGCYFDENLDENAVRKTLGVVNKYFTAKEAGPSEADLSVCYSADVPAEGYTIDVGDGGIKIGYSDGAGAYYAAVTLGQIFSGSEGSRIPYIRVSDSPDTSLRGFHISSQDKVGKISTYKAIIDRLSELKMNLLELAVFRPSSIQIETFSAITEYEYGLTVDDCKELVAYGRENYVEVVPYMETFGHMDEALRYPQFADMRNTFTPGCAVLSIYDEKVHEFLRGYVDDMIECFDPRFVTIGGDEVGAMLTGKNLENAPDGAKDADVFIYYLDLMYDICSERGVETYCCYDVIDKLYASARKPLKDMFARMPDMTIIVWQYEEDSTFTEACDRLDKLGAKYVIMPSTNTFGSCSGRLTTAEKNITTGVNVALARNTGVITAMYGDGGTRNTWITEINALAYAAGCCWNYAGNVRKYDAYLDYVNDNVFVEPTGKLRDAWQALQRHNDVLGRSWGLAWLTGIGNQGYVTNAMLDTYMSFQPGKDKSVYEASVAKTERIIGLAENVLSVLGEVTLNGVYADEIRAEMTITARQMVVLAEYMKMLLQLEGGLKTEDELRAKAAEMYAYALYNVELYRETWLMVNRKGVLEDSVNWLDIPMGLFNRIGRATVATGDDLMLLTPDTLPDLDEIYFSKGYIWSDYGKNYPTVSAVNGIYSYNDIYGIISERSVYFADGVAGAEGKVFAIDGKSLTDNYRYQFYYGAANPTSRLKTIFYWPCVFTGEGSYVFTAKVKFKDGSSVKDKVFVSAMASDGVLHSLQGTTSFSEEDENGWVTATWTFDNVAGYDYACIGVNSKPEMSEDTLYISGLSLKKI